MTPVRWGILSTAKIGVEKVLPAMRRCASVELRGIASRNLAAAQAVATQFGMPRAYGSYEALLADPDIEAVYNPLPNPMHVPLTLAAVQAGKHVLCEKPMAMSAAELDVLRPFANQLHIHEAFMVRHHPQWRQVRELVRDGSIGELRYVQVPFGYFNIEANNIRNRSDQGGGALYDIGCYAIAAGRWFFEAEPERVIAAVDRDPAFGTDRLVSGLLDFGGARQLAFTVATQAARYQRIQLVGTRGRIEIEIPFNPAPGEGCRFHIDDASSLDGRGIHTIVVPACDQYQLQAEAFSQAVRKVKPDASALDDAIKNLRVIEALFASEKSGRFEKP